MAVGGVDELDLLSGGTVGWITADSLPAVVDFCWILELFCLDAEWVSCCFKSVSRNFPKFSGRKIRLSFFVWMMYNIEKYKRGDRYEDISGGLR